MSPTLADLTGLRVTPTRVELGAGPSATQFMQRLAGDAGLVCLSGEWAGGGAVLTSEPLVVLEAGTDPWRAFDAVPVLTAVPDAGDAVCGGWFGWLGYDGEYSLAFYDNVLRLREGVWHFESLRSGQRAAELDARLARLRQLCDGPEVALDWHAGRARGAAQGPHLDAVERAVEEIRAGEIYQVNICTRITGSLDGDPAGMFATACDELAPSYAAYVADGPRAVVSLSPELFLRRDGRIVTTRPIKGTAPNDGGEDGARALRASAKDAAENVMIVDLMRNDLGRVCETGSVLATSLLDVESHPGVWHLVSTVQGRLRDGVGDGDLLRATFPPGSVTGAPKDRAIAVIAARESLRRGTYTGAVGYASPVRGLELNVAIRTFEVAGGRYELGVGGGITADSVPMREWRECLDKAAPLLRAIGVGLPALPADAVPRPEQLAAGVFETILVRDGMPVRLADHLARLDRSCRELYRRGIPPDLAARARRVAADAGMGRQVLRIVVAPGGETTLSITAAAPAATGSHAVTVSRTPGCWRHKWADRAELEAIEGSLGAGRVPLFVNDGFVRETSRGNVMVLAPGPCLLTPALTDDVLPGVTRRAVLDLARDRGWPVVLRPLRVADLHAGVPFWTSALSGAVPIHSLDGVDLPRDDAAVAELARHLSGAVADGGAAAVR